MKTRSLSRGLVTTLTVALTLVAFAALEAQENAPIGVVDVNQIMSESATGRAAQQEFRQLLEEKQNQADQLQQEIQELQQQLEQGQLSLSEDRQAELQAELEEKQIAWQRFQTDSQRQLQAKQRETLRQLEQQILPIIQEVGRNGGYGLIFNKFESGLLYVDDTVEITDRVLARLGESDAAAQPEDDAVTAGESVQAPGADEAGGGDD